MEDFIWLVYGLKNRDAAEIELEDLFAHGEVTPGERPRIRRYYATHKITGKRVARYGIIHPLEYL